MKSFAACLFAFALLGCTASKHFVLDMARKGEAITGSSFYSMAADYNWKTRDSFAVAQILAGNMPSFLERFVRIDVSVQDSTTGKTVRAWYFVAPDYLSVGTDEDWARVPLTPMASQLIADSFGCFLPTRKIVNDVHRAAAVTLEPLPMTEYRDATPTMWQHHLLIEGQRSGRRGLVSGIKKDVVLSGKISRDARPDRVAIYGWHKSDGKAIQPLYTGHVNSYVDYSHGTRLVYRKIFVEGVGMDYIEVLQHPVFRRLLSDEDDCDFYRY
jgi:hypothetical protein